jgi:hypothetical protein
MTGAPGAPVVSSFHEYAISIPVGAVGVGGERTGACDGNGLGAGLAPGGCTFEEKHQP